MRTGRENWLAAVISGFDTYYKKLGLTEQKRATKAEEAYRQQMVGLSRDELIQKAQSLKMEKDKLEEAIRANKATEAEKQRYDTILQEYNDANIALQNRELDLKEKGGYYKKYPPVGGQSQTATADQIMGAMRANFDDAVRMFSGIESVDQFNNIIGRLYDITLTEDKFNQLKSNNELFGTYMRNKIANRWLRDYPQYSAEISKWIQGYEFAATPTPEPRPRRGLFGTPPSGPTPEVRKTSLMQSVPQAQGTIVRGKTLIGSRRPNQTAPDFGIAKQQPSTGGATGSFETTGGNIFNKMGAGFKKIFGNAGPQTAPAAQRQRVFVNNSLFYINPDNTVTNSAGQPVTDATVLDMVFKELEKQNRNQNQLLNTGGR